VRPFSYLPGVSNAGRELALGHLAVQAETIRAVSAIRDARIAYLLLKGIGLDLWLYPDAARPVSRDIDVLIAPEQFELACETVRALGTIVDGHQRGLRKPVPEVRFVPDARGGVPIELHRSFHFVHAPVTRCWTLLTADKEQIEVAGTPIDVPSVPARACLLALHATYHGPAGEWAIEDLRRALGVVSIDDWRRAASLSCELGASAAFASGLRLLPAGAEVADTLELAPADDPALRLHARSANPPTFRMLGYATQRPLLGLARLLGAELIPSADRMRTWYPLARRGRGGLAAAHAARVGRLGLTTPRLLASWREARSAARRPQ
jgi:Uncharacterised nucleotidyltransferase